MKEVPHIELCTLPTPLVEAPRLSARLGGPRILIKRDDLTGLAMGGNKARSLEYLMTEVRDSRSDIVLAVGPQQSNWLCNLTAACRRLGIDTVLFLFKGNNQVQGNLLLDRLMGAEVRYTNIDIHNISSVYEQMEALADELRKKGRKPHVFQYGAVTPLGVMGYVSLATEICQQLKERNLQARYLFLADGSGCTHAGLLLGMAHHQSSLKVIGIMLDLRYTKKEQVSIIADAASKTANFLKLNHSFKPEQVICNNEYLGSNAPTRESIEAVRLVAETEGIFLDPVYSGKAMAALIGQILDSKIKRQDTVILYHSGGLPAMFAYNNELSAI